MIGDPSTALADLNNEVNLGSSIGCVTVTVQDVSASPTSLTPLVNLIGNWKFVRLELMYEIGHKLR